MRDGGRAHLRLGHDVHHVFIGYAQDAEVLLQEDLHILVTGVECPAVCA